MLLAFLVEIILLIFCKQIYLKKYIIVGIYWESCDWKKRPGFTRQAIRRLLPDVLWRDSGRAIWHWEIVLSRKVNVIETFLCPNTTIFNQNMFFFWRYQPDKAQDRLNSESLGSVSANGLYNFLVKPDNSAFNLILELSFVSKSTPVFFTSIPTIYQPENAFLAGHCGHDALACPDLPMERSRETHNRCDIWRREFRQEAGRWHWHTNWVKVGSNKKCSDNFHIPRMASFWWHFDLSLRTRSHGQLRLSGKSITTKN